MGRPDCGEMRRHDRNRAAGRMPRGLYRDTPPDLGCQCDWRFEKRAETIVLVIVQAAAPAAVTRPTRCTWQFLMAISSRLLPGWSMIPISNLAPMWYRDAFHTVKFRKSIDHDDG